MRSAFKFANSFYFTTQDVKGHKHHYRLTAQDVADSNPMEWSDETIIRMDNPGFKFSQIISDESATRLWLALEMTGN
jgi:hypothetical protein